MGSNASGNEIFTDYYINNKGMFFKTFEININNIHSSCDIYWGDPNIIFNDENVKKIFPLAITVVPHGKNAPAPRIFIHEKLEKKYNTAFEIIIAHEIGHLWLHDVVGINRPSTSIFMREYEAEMWADYFAYCFFGKYRNINCLEEFNKILNEVSFLQMQIYNLDPGQYTKDVYSNKINNLSILNDKVKMELKIGNRLMIQMRDTIEITLNSLGDVFK